MNLAATFARERLEALEAKHGPWDPRAGFDIDIDVSDEERRPFAEALAQPGMSLVAEFKRRSPTHASFQHSIERIVEAYEQAGATALSVLTEPKHFGGDFEDLATARAASSLPILCKDFVVHPAQINEAARAGADAVLLMVAILGEEELPALYSHAQRADLDVLIEVHSADEVQRALELDADVIGINNRNFSGDWDDLGVHRLDPTHELQPVIPTGKTVVSESHIRSREDVEDLERIGVDAILVGSFLLESEDPGDECRRLIGARTPTSPPRS